MMRSPLLQQLQDKHGLQTVTEQNIDAFLARHENVVLFFTENPQNFPESNDVAVALPELLQCYSGKLVAGIVAEESERILHKRYAFNKWPTLVFLRNGHYLGVISGMQDWVVFHQEFERLLQADPVDPPAFRIPVVAESVSGCQPPK